MTTQSLDDSHWSRLRLIGLSVSFRAHHVAQSTQSRLHDRLQFLVLRRHALQKDHRKQCGGRAGDNYVTRRDHALTIVARLTSATLSLTDISNTVSETLFTSDSSPNISCSMSKKQLCGMKIKLEKQLPCYHFDGLATQFVETGRCSSHLL